MLERQKHNCVLGISRLAIYKNKLDEAENSCSNRLTSRKETCFREIAEKIAESNIEDEVIHCKKIESAGERDNCYHNIA